MRNRPTRQQAAATLMACVFCLTLVEPAFAQAAGFQTVLDNIIAMINGGIAKSMAVIAVIIVGFAWMFGFMDLRKAAYVVLGIAIVFGAAEIVGEIAG